MKGRDSRVAISRSRIRGMTRRGKMHLPGTMRAKDRWPYPPQASRFPVDKYHEHWRKPNGPSSAFVPAAIILLPLLFFPTLAIVHMAQGGDSWILFGYAAGISFVTYLLYRHDKRMAQMGEWRTAESTLHLFELLGGWPGAFLAQRTFRHKTSKISYQIVFWTIVFLHEFISFDFTQNWECLKKVVMCFHG